MFLLGLTLALGAGNVPPPPAGFSYLRSAIDGSILYSAIDGTALLSDDRYRSAIDGSLLLSAIDNQPLYPATGV